MTVNFDIISDLNLESFDNITWENKVTSPFCIVAGNISARREILYRFLSHLSKLYEGVFFIDGELEHKEFNGDFKSSYQSLAEVLSAFDNVVFMQDHIVVLNNYAIVSTNGWTTFDFSGERSAIEVIDFLDMRGLVLQDTALEIDDLSQSDQSYLANSVRRCQQKTEIENIIIVTNTVPRPSLVTHDPDFDSVIGDQYGNPSLSECLNFDTQHKVSTWVFGKYTGDLDFNIDGVRFVNNPLGDKDFDVYYPKVISP